MAEPTISFSVSLINGSVPIVPIYSDAFIAGVNAKRRKPSKTALRKFKDLSEADIVRFRRSVQRLSGIYFLIKDKAIVYIGQSANIHVRVSDHAKGIKDFDSFAYVECHPSQLDEWERAYINKIMPPLNKDVETARIRCKSIVA